jgi:hypothetical protein
MEIIKIATWYDYCEYWTDNGFYLELNHGASQYVKIRIYTIKNGNTYFLLELDSEYSKHSIWKTTMLTALAKRLFANNGREIIKRIWEQK